MKNGILVGQITSEELDNLILQSVNSDKWMSFDRINQLVNVNAGFGEDWSVREDSINLRIGVLIGQNKLEVMGFEESYGYQTDYRTRYIFRAYQQETEDKK